MWAALLNYTPADSPGALNSPAQLPFTFALLTAEVANGKSACSVIPVNKLALSTPSIKRIHLSSPLLSNASRTERLRVPEQHMRTWPERQRVDLFLTTTCCQGFPTSNASTLDHPR